MQDIGDYLLKILSQSNLKSSFFFSNCFRYHTNQSIHTFFFFTVRKSCVAFELDKFVFQSVDIFQ